MWPGGIVQAQPDAVVKELVYTCQKEPWRPCKFETPGTDCGLALSWWALVTSSLQEGFAIMDVNDSAKDYNWQLRYQNRYVSRILNSLLRGFSRPSPCQLGP